MREVTTEELITDLNQFLTYIQGYYPRLSPIYNLMSETGLRLCEATQTSRFTDIQTAWLVKTAKRNNERIIFKDDLSQQVNHYILTQPDAYQSRPQTLYEYNMDLFFRPKIYRIGQKNAYNHLFRHCIARKKKTEGWTDNAIKVYLGEKYQVSADQYIYGKIYTNS